MTMPIRPAAVAAHVARRQATEAATDAERLRATAALHVSDGARRPKCTECETRYPCRTARILKGEQ
jgi:hypothetical protein